MKNSRHFVEMMGNVRNEEDEMLVSFDVTSLFTNVPIEEAVRVIQGSLQEDETLGRVSSRKNNLKGKREGARTCNINIHEYRPAHVA